MRCGFSATPAGSSASPPQWPCPATCPGSEREGLCASACWPSSPGQVPRRQGRRHSAFPHARPRSRIPAYPFDEHAAREWVEREADSGPRDTGAQSRQVGAPWHGPKLRELRKPALVLHGDKDPILRVSAARGTATAIDGARLVILPGVGHDLPALLWPVIADEVRQNADRAHSRELNSASQPSQNWLHACATVSEAAALRSHR
jgi:pimeloyl-ACP methyl ester carboxylesterase